jgi:hypothetical protein
LFVAALLVALQAATAEPARTLVEIHVITRHGSRLPLTKDADTQDEGGPGTLTALGQKQHYDLGMWLRRRYNHHHSSSNASNSSRGDGFFDSFFSPRVNLTSSALQRTVVSANSLALGLFPPSSRDPRNESLLPASTVPANVPVYTDKTSNDVTIRGYEKCESGLRLSELYASKEWRDLEGSHVPLLEKLSEMDPFQSYADLLLRRIPLEEVWNPYDAVAVAKVECGHDQNSTACRASDPALQFLLSDSEWMELQDLAERAEILKYTSSRRVEGDAGGSLAGGNLLRQIMDRMEEAEPSFLAAAGKMDKFYLYSAHYPTILSVLAALENDPGYWPTDEDGTSGNSSSGLPPPRVPDFAAALILELYAEQGAAASASASKKSVRVLYKPGYQDDAAYEIPLGRGCSVGSSPSRESSHCDLSTLASSFLGGYTTALWCRECDNAIADICLAANLTSALSSNQPTTSTASDSSTQTSGGLGAVPSLFVGILCGIFLTIAIMALAGWYRRRREQKLSFLSTEDLPQEDSAAQSDASTTADGASARVTDPAIA